MDAWLLSFLSSCLLVSSLSFFFFFINTDYKFLHYLHPLPETSHLKGGQTRRFCKNLSTTLKSKSALKQVPVWYPFNSGKNWFTDSGAILQKKKSLTKLYCDVGCPANANMGKTKHKCPQSTQVVADIN